MLLLRESFAKESIKYLTVQLPHFNIRLKIHRKDVTLHGSTAKNNQPGERNNPTTNRTDIQHRPPRLIQSSADYKTTSTSHSTTKPVGEKERNISTMSTTTPLTGKVNKPGRDKGFIIQTPQSTSGNTTNPTRAQSSGVSKGQETQPRGSNPRGAPYDPSATSKTRG